MRIAHSNKVLATVVLAAVVVVGLFLLTRPTSGLAGKGLSPGVSDGISVLSRSPVITDPSQTVSDAVNSFAAGNHDDPSQALAGLHRLGADLGSLGIDVYGYQSHSGGVCVVAVTLAGFCAKSLADGTPGMHWMIGGGSPETPSVLVGLAADNVNDVTLQVDGVKVVVRLESNLSYAEFPSDAKNATVNITRSDGSQNSFDLALQG